MKTKFKATLIILALMLFTSLILAMRNKTNDVITNPVVSVQTEQVKEIEETVKVSKSYVRYIEQPVKLKAQTLELSSAGFDAGLPLPELMQQVGFKVEIESDTDYTNLVPNAVD